MIGNDYYRIRVGIDHPGMKDLVSNYVLNKFNSDQISQFIFDIAKFAEKFNIKIALESIESPEILINLLRKVKLKNIGVVYDTGNRALLSESYLEDINILREYIIHIHIKDIRKPLGNEAIMTDAAGKTTFEVLPSSRYNEVVKRLDSGRWKSKDGKNPYQEKENSKKICNQS